MRALEERLRASVRAHDAAIRGRSLRIWIGAEPTFTDRSSHDPAWLFAAEGADKEPRARVLLLSLVARLSPAPLLVRSGGRHYPGEERARFGYGALFRRDGGRLWDGPPDPLQLASPPAPPFPPEALRTALGGLFEQRGASALEAEGPAGELRLAVRFDPPPPDATDTLLSKPGAAAGEAGPAVDPASVAGLFVFSFRAAADGLVVELPGFLDTRRFLESLEALAAAAASLELQALVLSGFRPPVDERLAFLSVTPDPGVVEVNLAPAPDLSTFERWSEAVFAAAADAGLSPERYRFNGQASDSGGGGQLTFGGPTPRASPFFLFPHLLPGLVRFLNRHPSLSYSFASECLGSASQGPRTDEGVRERFEELAVALDRLDALGDGVGPEELCSTLAPLLVDSAGNSHRAELNVEKLWNPSLPGRGTMGVVELRSLRMQRRPEQQVAIALLFRSLLARLAAEPFRAPLIHWGAALHDRFALPHFLAEDLAEVLADLRAHGLALGAFEELLLAPPEPLAEVELDGARLVVTPALEFWPLMGDVASQEQRGARLFDSSCARLQLCVQARPGEAPGLVGACGHEVPLAVVQTRPCARHLAGLRYRAFTPNPGLHPGLSPNDPLEITWSRGAGHLLLELHGWRPLGGAYDCLPPDAAEAARRRRERIVVRRLSRPVPLRPFAPAQRNQFCVDLRRAAGPPSGGAPDEASDEASLNLDPGPKKTASGATR